MERLYDSISSPLVRRMNTSQLRPLNYTLCCVLTYVYFLAPDYTLCVLLDQCLESVIVKQITHVLVIFYHLTAPA